MARTWRVCSSSHLKPLTFLLPGSGRHSSWMLTLTLSRAAQEEQCADTQHHHSMNYIRLCVTGGNCFAGMYQGALCLHVFPTTRGEYISTILPEPLFSVPIRIKKRIGHYYHFHLSFSLSMGDRLDKPSPFTGTIQGRTFPLVQCQSNPRVR